MSAARSAGTGSRAATAVSRPTWDEDVAWQDRALCRGANPDLFFPPQTFEKKEEREVREAQAKAVCAQCPVRLQCLEYALTTREPFGVWGGLNETERRRLQERSAQRAAG